MDPEISGLSGGDNLYPPSGSSNIPGSGEPYSVPGNMTAMASSRYQSNPPVGSPGRQARPQRRGNSYEVPAPAPTQALSTAESHRSNLVSLSAISFFGAGMAWATVFSGTRGDLVFISWAACCFIVGAVSAASATSLLDADGELLNRYKSVRWTVRLLAVWSTVNVFVGVMLVSAAILVLDPNASQPSARMEGEAEFTVQPAYLVCMKPLPCE
ncbi:hypothetical protein FRC09_014922 [Ceratobasidium sp. 395]|nr:hypothetical protein FRC09_014922 [Ceratobasidium sp. 395]